MDLSTLRGMLPDVSRSPIARSTGLLLHNISSAAAKMNTYEFVSHISSDGLLYDDPEMGVDIRTLLSSKFDAEKAEGLKRLLALISGGADVCHFFPDVIKVVVSPSMPVKRMAYTFLAHYSSRRPDEALMVINTLQKELGSPNPLTRAQGIRAMAAMRLRSATPVVLLSVRRVSRDPSPLVRRSAALALASVHALECPPVSMPRMDDVNSSDAEGGPGVSTGTGDARTSTGGTEEDILELLDVLLSDSDPSVVAAACCSYASICPGRLEPLGAHFRTLCHMLGLLDEWGQAAALELLLRYGVAKFGRADKETWALQAEQLAGKDTRDVSGRSKGMSFTGTGGLSVSQQRPEDLQLLLRTTRMLALSPNGAVVLGACALHWELNADVSEIRLSVVPALLFLLQRAPHCQHVVLRCISTMAAVAPALFVDRVSDLFILPTDSRSARQHKLDLLVSLARDDNADLILKELEDYVQDLDPWFSIMAVRAVGAIAVKLPGIRTPAVRGLLQLLSMHTHSEATGSSEANREATDGSKESGPGESKGKGEGNHGEPKSLAQSRSSSQSGEGGVGDLETKETWEEAPGEREEQGVGTLVLEVLLALQRVVEICPEYHLEVMLMLLPRLENIQPPQALAVVVRMLFFAAPSSRTILRAAPFALHPLVAQFKKHASASLKLQLLNTCMRVVLLLHSEASTDLDVGMNGESAQLSVATTFALARSLLLGLLDAARGDACIDVRDRARFVRGLLDADNLLQQHPVSRCMESLAWRAFCGSRSNSTKEEERQNSSRLRGRNEALDRFQACEETTTTGRGRFPLSSLSHYVNHMAPNYLPLPKDRILAAPEPAAAVDDLVSDRNELGSEEENLTRHDGTEHPHPIPQSTGTVATSQTKFPREARPSTAENEVEVLANKTALENWLGSG